MKINITLPELGEGIETAILAAWNYQVGDRITEQDDIAEVVTDKAVFNIPATDKGVLSQIIAEEGKEINVGDLIAVMEKDT